MEERWEYLVLDFAKSQMVSVMARKLTELGVSGWEVVGLSDVSRVGFDSVAVVVKRRRPPLQPPETLEAGWKPDPLGRNELRWWDGIRWEASVHNGGKTSYDWPVETPSST